MAFLQVEDYGVQIRNEILTILDDTQDQAKLLRAENIAIAQIKNYLNGKYDVEAIFQPAGDPDVRDKWMVTLVIDLALYHLYSQTGVQNVPEHRSQRYEDAIQWLNNVGRGFIKADLPMLEEALGEIRMNSHPVSDHKW